jgi:signal transduction histidine kinase
VIRQSGAGGRPAPDSWPDAEELPLHETVVPMSAAVERARGEAALRKSEDRYRALFNRIDEGFCILEMRIQEGEPLDYRFIEVNEAFEKQSTLADAKGRWMRELRPGHEEHWFEIYRDVALTGRPARFTARGQELENRDFDVYAFRMGPPAELRVGVLFKDITERGRLEHALRRAQDELEERVRERTLQLAQACGALENELQERRVAEARIRTLFGQVVTVQEGERQRIARAIHDRAAQPITALRLNLEALGAQCAADAVLAGQVLRLQAMAADVDQNIDGLLWGLHPAALDHLGLAAALRSLVSGWSRRSLVPAEFHGADVDGLRLAAHVEINLYRIAQEALQNVSRLEAATRVGVVLERRDGVVVLMVEEDGVGFDTGPIETRDPPCGLGLAVMRERATLIGGELEVESTPGAGTILYVRVPHIGRVDAQAG